VSQNFYTRATVPVGEKIILEAQFKDSAGFPKDSETLPTIEVLDAASDTVIATTASEIYRVAVGRYRYDLTVPTSFQEGLWSDRWAATIDGYSVENVFDFTVSSVATAEAVGASVPVKQYTLDDEEIQEELTQQEIKGILRLRKFLKMRVRSTAFKPDGTPCPLLPNDQLDLALLSSLAEFNATPVLTSFSFDSDFIQKVCADIVTQGAMLIVWAGQAVIEAGFEFTVNDNGVTYNPPPVSSTISGIYNSNLSDYRAKLKEIKRNLRPSPKGLASGNIFAINPRLRAIKNHLKERRIL
jgi:hypothetical protein